MSAPPIKSAAPIRSAAPLMSAASVTSEAPASSAAPFVAVVLKYVDRRPDIDPLTGHVHTDRRSSGMSDADMAALEWALRLADAWGWPLTALTAGPPEAEAVLREALAVGANDAVRASLDEDAPSEAVASALASWPLAPDAGLWLCGAWSLDRASGSVPAFLAAHLGIGQALGLVGLSPVTDEAAPKPGAHPGAHPGAQPGVLHVERRLDGGRRERLRVSRPTVISLEGSTATLRRAPLPGLLSARNADITVVPRPAGSDGAHPSSAHEVQIGPLRPRASALAAPSSELGPRERILSLTRSLAPRTPPKTLVLDPPAAAAAILDQLEEWSRR
jgi:electron transfer flavoprotein beta subunit